MSMTYELVRRLTDLQERIEDWKRRMCTEPELEKAILDAYKALKDNTGLEIVPLKPEEKEEK